MNNKEFEKQMENERLAGDDINETPGYQGIYEDKEMSNSYSPEVREYVSDWRNKLFDMGGELDEDGYKILCDLYDKATEHARNRAYSDMEDGSWVELDEDLPDYGHNRNAPIWEGK